MTLVSNPLHTGSSDGTAYKLDSKNSRINWKGTKPGGEHYGYIDVVKGSIETDGKVITGGKFTIDMNSIVNEDLTNESFNKRLVGHLLSEDFFHTEAHPEAYFEITSVKSQRSAKDGFTANYMITGDLTIRGIKKEISFPANINMESGKVTAKTGEIVLDRTEWNVNFQSRKIFANLADSFIHDEMIVTLDLKFTSK